jgi:hypothetical protein
MADLIIAAFVILAATSVAVVGSLVVLSLFDLVQGRKKPVPHENEEVSEPNNAPDLGEALNAWRRERDV